MYYFATVILLCWLSACVQPTPLPSIEAGVELNLAQHSKEFKQEVIEVTEGVYVAIGYGLANSILLEGNDGVIVVDTMESNEAAIPVKAGVDPCTGRNR